MSNYLINSVDLPVNSDTFKYKDDAITPNGVKEAARFENTENKSSIITPVVSSTLIITNSKFYCRSVFVKSAGVNSVIIPFVFSTSNNSLNRWVAFDINTKTIGYSHPSDPDCYANYKEYDNGWIRFWVTVEKIAERTISQNWYMGGYGSSSNKHKFWAWGAQFEEVANLSSEPGEYEQTGGDSLIFYNRDSNITELNPISSLTYIPTYGSRVQFSCNTNKYETSDGYFNQIPLSINSLTAKFDLKFDLNEEESKKLINFIENKNGVYDITFSDSSSIYKNIDGFCTEYAINRINRNHYEIAISLDVKDVPNLFNWYSMSYVKPNYKTWSNNILYKKYDIVQYNTTNILNKLNSFYYCGYNHNSKEGIDTEPGDSISPWRQDFFFEPDLAMQNSVNLKVEKINFKNSFSQNIKTKKNIATTDFTYKFSNITTQKARAILHFLENKGGYRRFRVNMDSVYNKPKVFYAPSWNHTWKFEDSHDIEVQLIEDPLGVIPKD
jgi:phage-related protein